MSTETPTNPAYESAQRATEQIREFGERATGASRAFGQLALDGYEQAVRNFVEAEQKVAQAAPVDWVGAAISAHASFVQDLTTAYLRAARSVLV